MRDSQDRNQHNGTKKTGALHYNIPVFINPAVDFHLGAGRFYFCRGKTGRGPGEKFFAKCFWIEPCSKFSLAAKIFLRSHNYCLLVREMISFRACRADSSAANPRIYMKGVKALASMAL